MPIPKTFPSVDCLRSFHYAAVYRSFSVAGDDVLCIGQPTVSKHVRRLERQLGRLFERKPRGVELTPRGRVLFDLIAPVMERLESLEESFHESCGELSVGSVTVVVSESLGFGFLAPAVKEFIKGNPSVAINVLAEHGPAQEAVANGMGDFGVVSMASRLPELEYTELLQASMAVITPVGHPLTNAEGNLLEQACGYPFVWLSRKSGGQRAMEDILERRGLRLKVAVQVDALSDVKKAVGLGLGVSIVPQLAVSDGDNLAVLPLRHDFAISLYGIAVRRGAFLSKPARDLIAAIVMSSRSLHSQ